MAFLRAAHPWDGYDQKLYESVLDYRECEKQLKLLSNSTAVLPFIDATAKLPSGILSLNVNDYGDYYQCLQIDNQVEDMHLEGKYCFIVVPFSQNISVPGWMSMGGKMSKFTFSAVGRSLSESATASTDEFLKSYLAPRNVQKFTSNATISRAALRLGVCIPKVCNIDQVNDFITPPIPIPKVEYLSGPCRLPGDKMYTIADYVTFGIFGTILLLTILSTCYDLFQVFIRRKSKAPNRLFTMMSIYTNTKRLLKFLPPKYSMDCVDGIRAISMIWVMCGHAYVFELLSPAHNLLDMIEWTTHLTSTWINTAPMVVDTFFMLTGLFCVYTLPNRITAKRFLKSIHIFYLYRYFRTLPVLVVAILIQASIIHWIADGPDWDRISYAVVCCRNRWWATVLHVQNIIEPTAVCVFQSWYLTVDTQLYFLSPFIIVFLLMSKAIAWFVLGVSFVISIVTLAYYVYYYKYPSVLNGLWYSQQFFEYYVNFYANTATRASPFIVGLMVGYILWLNREKGLFLSKKLVIALWTLSMLGFTYVVVMIYVMAQLPYNFTYDDMAFNCLMRSVWAASVGWIIIACAHGYGGPINWFLSLPMWKLPSRISYAVYLIHVQVEVLHTVGVVKPRYFTEIDTLYSCASYVTISMILGFCICILVDAPTSTLLKILFVRKRSTPDTRNEVEIEENEENKTKL